MGTLEKQLEEEKQRVQTAESQRGAGTGKHQRALRVVVLRTQHNTQQIFHALFGVLVEATVPPVPLQLPWVTWKDCLVAQLV